MLVKWISIVAVLLVTGGIFCSWLLRKNFALRKMIQQTMEEMNEIAEGALKYRRDHKAWPLDIGDLERNTNLAVFTNPFGYRYVMITSEAVVTVTSLFPSRKVHQYDITPPFELIPAGSCDIIKIKKEEVR